MEKHRVPVKKELIVYDIIVIAERQTLDWIITQGKDTNPGFWVTQSQMFWNMKYFSTNIYTDDVWKSWLWRAVIFLFLIRSIQVVHRSPWFD